MCNHRLGIIIQGAYKNGYTLDSIIRYKNTIKCIIVLSVWQDDSINKNDLENLKKIKDLYIVYNEKPNKAGVQNVNYQIVSTLNGLNKLKEFDCKYVIKTRTDHSFDLEVLLSINPSGKIIAFETDDLIISPFLVCDFLFYGQVELIYQLFNIPLSEYGDNRETYNDNFQNIHRYVFYYKIAIEYNFELYAERHIIINFFKSLGYTVPRSSILSRFYSIILISKYFILIEPNLINYQTLKNYKALYYHKKDNFYYYKSLVDNRRLVYLFLKICRYEIVEFIRRVLFYPKFILMIWRIN